jgi:hypothetical protein
VPKKKLICDVTKKCITTFSNHFLYHVPFYHHSRTFFALTNSLYHHPPRLFLSLSFPRALFPHLFAVLASPLFFFHYLCRHHRLDRFITLFSHTSPCTYTYFPLSRLLHDPRCLYFYLPIIIDSPQALNSHPHSPLLSVSTLSINICL